MPGTVRLHRVFKAPPERVYRAFVDPLAMTKWLPPYGFVAEMHSHDPRVGGGYRMSFKDFAAGTVHTFGGTYAEMVPNELLRYTDRFDDPTMPGEMSVEVRLRAVLLGTDLTVVQEGIPDAVPVEFCYSGWQESLIQLAALVEHEHPQEGP